MDVKLTVTFLVTLLLVPLAELQAQEHWTFLDSGQVRLGVNMDAGGALGWLSRSHSSENVLNAYDHGRYVQQSFPHAQLATTYRVRDTGIGDCSYLAPLQTFALKPGLVFEYEVVLALGTAEQLRAGFRKLHDQEAGNK